MKRYLDSIQRNPLETQPQVVRRQVEAGLESDAPYFYARKTPSHNKKQPFALKRHKVYRRAAFAIIVVAALVVSAPYLINIQQSKTSRSSKPSPTQSAVTPVSKVTAVTADSTVSAKLASAWKIIMAGREGSADIAVYNHTTGQTTEYTNSGGTFDTASIVKLSILEGLLIEDQANNQSLTSSQLAQATPMIENSNDNAASDLWSQVGGASAMNNFFQQVGATSTTAGTNGEWGLTQTTALDQLKVVNTLAYPGALLSASSAQSADSLLDRVEADQRWGVSSGVPSGVSIELKDGWLPEQNGWVINSIGHIHGDGADYTIAVLTSGNPSEQYGINTIQSLSSATWNALAQ